MYTLRTPRVKQECLSKRRKNKTEVPSDLLKKYRKEISILEKVYIGSNREFSVEWENGCEHHSPVCKAPI